MNSFFTYWIAGLKLLGKLMLVLFMLQACFIPIWLLCLLISVIPGVGEQTMETIHTAVYLTAVILLLPPLLLKAFQALHISPEKPDRSRESPVNQRSPWKTIR